MTLHLSNKEARTLLLDLQGLSRKRHQKLTSDGLYELVHSLGYVQLDSIRTIERAHHMILFSRHATYRQQQLIDLIEKESRLFEHWTHDASIIPAEFFPHWRHRFNRSAKQLKNRAGWKNRLGSNPSKVIRTVKERIKQEGPLMARDFDDAHKGRGQWWGWGPSKTALEYLWHTGELAIARRQGFQKVYDLAERIVPADIHGEKISQTQSVDWFCREALHRLGLATPGEIAAFWNHVSIADATKWVNAHLGKDLIEISFDANADAPQRKTFALKEVEQYLAEAKNPSTKLRFLSPFDPVIRDRKRLKRLFDFDYRIEVFVPEKKRQYGYYVLPILEGTRFTGRTDIKANRKDDILEVKGLWLEPGVKLTNKREQAFRLELDRLAKFTGVSEIKTEKVLNATRKE